ncbi:MAG: nicotinate (nicotinamide) nucleotide adenylyltransferase [Clostridia bacterium]|nr:nicotinate (nicotinamide) nucleotide adenylyltransferase [Clostridia bacterium]
MQEGIAVFGGSFNPPLNSHFLLAEQVLNEMSFIKKIIFVPVSTKYNKKGLASNEDRLNMVKAVCEENEGFEVSDIELKDAVQPFTVETLNYLDQKYHQTLYFMIGTDNLKQLRTWNKADELVTKYKFIILERDEDKMDEIIGDDEFLSKYRQAFIKFNNPIRTNLSSSYVRAQIKEGKSIKYLTPDSVIEYIKERELYK